MSNGFFGFNLKKYKSVLFSSLFLVAIMMIGLFGGSYAWYAFNDARTSIDIGSGKYNSGVDIIFNTSQYLNVTTGAPILSTEEMRDYIEPNIFTVLTPSADEIAIKIELVDIVMDNELKNNNFKFRLYQNGVNINEGNFGSIGSSSSIVVKNMGIVNSNTTYEYKLYIWLADDGACTDTSDYASCQSQNSMMGKSFSGKIKVSAVIKGGNGEVVTVPSVNTSTDFDSYLVSLANNISVDTYTNYSGAQMYAFSHEAGAQQSAWTTEQLVDYRYIGSSPNNYVYFNCTDTSLQNSSDCEIWRIVGVFSVDDGTGNIEQRVKLVAGSGIDASTSSSTQSGFSWDSSINGDGFATTNYGLNQWGEVTASSYAGADLMQLLNSGAYYNRNTGTCYVGSGNTNVECNFGNSGLTSSAKIIISDATYYLGAVDDLTYNADSIYLSERGNTVAFGDLLTRTTNWTGKVGLMYPSDYIYSYANGVDATCYNGISSCDNSNPRSSWIYNSNDSSNQWLLSPYSGSEYLANYIRSSGDISNTSDPIYNSFGVRPVVYLDADVKVKAGNGTSDSPYKLVYSFDGVIEDNPTLDSPSEEEFPKATEYLISKSNDSTVTTYSSGTTTEMYTFSQTAGVQQSGWTTEQLVDYRYIGSSPNNYVYYNCTDTSVQNSTNCEVWRILGVFYVDDGSGNIVQRVKIISGSGISDGTQNYFAWDSAATNYPFLNIMGGYTGINQWGESTKVDGSSYEGSDLMVMLNSGSYYNRTSGICYIAGNETLTTCNFQTTGLTSSAKTLIATSKYYLGGFSSTVNYSLPGYNLSLGSSNGSVFYTNERGESLPSGTDDDDGVIRTTNWTGKVALMYPSDYIYSYAYGVDDTCYNTPGSCGSGTPSNGWIYNSNDWGYDGTVNYQFFLNPSSSVDNVVLANRPDGMVLAGLVAYTGVYVGARPVMYLDNDVRIIDGNGSVNTPYQFQY